jgi:DNA-binding transcriptional MerR regulator
MTHPIDAAPIYRIGAVSRSTGVPVSTLRVWEARHRAFSPSKTEGQQRLFSEQDLGKARLLKQLTQQGHSIGAIASLDMGTLRRLCQPSQEPSRHKLAGTEALTMTVVGLGLANRIESVAMNTALGVHRCQVTAVFEDLAEAKRSAPNESAQVLLIKVNSLQNSLFNDIQSLVTQHTFAQTVVLYHFAPDAVVQTMRRAGWVVRRDPIADAELAELLLSVLFSPMDAAPQWAAGATSQRKYSDQTLRRVAGISTDVLCECPKHVAELITQLASFEQYSQECLNQNANDARLHAYLRAISGSARAVFENALERIAAHEGIDLTEAKG